MKRNVTAEPIYQVLEEMGRRVRRVREEAEASLRQAEKEYTENLDGCPNRHTAFVRDSHPG